MVFIEAIIISAIWSQVKKIPIVKRWNDWRTLKPNGLNALNSPFTYTLIEEY